MTYSIYNENFNCFFCSPIAGAGNSIPSDNKRGFLEQELQFLATLARLLTGVEITLDHYNAATSLTSILAVYYEHPVLHKVWCRFYGYQRDELSLYTQFNYDIAKDIYECFNIPELFVQGKYIPEYRVQEEEVQEEMSYYKEDERVKNAPALPEE